MSKASIHSFADLPKHISSHQKVTCLFSGGLDGAYLLHRLRQEKQGQVLALIVDVGGEDDCQRAARIAQRLGAIPLIRNELEHFGANFVLPALQTQACYLGGHPISASLSRPLLAHCAVQVAQEHGSHVILHSATSSQNSLRRFNGALAGLGFDGIYGTPYELSAISREEKQRTLCQSGVSDFKDRAHSFDTNFWCREFESGNLEDPESFVVEESLYRWSRDSQAPSRIGEDDIVIDIVRGVPVSLNGQAMDFVPLVRALNELAGKHCLGRFIGLEEIPGGAKVLEVREMPAAFVLLDAYRRIETACLSSETLREKMNIEQIWTREAVEGRWFDPLKVAAESFVSSLALATTGTVRYKLSYKALCPTSVKSPQPLYIRDRTAYESELCAKHSGAGSASMVRGADGPSAIPVCIDLAEVDGKREQSLPTGVEA